MKRGLVTLLVAAVASMTLFSAQAASHPSDLNTLTLDLILDSSGLVLIDGAMNRATYADAPSPAQRAAIAADVLDALGVRRDSVEVDPDTSLLYHEVGFTIWLHEAFANGASPGEVLIDSRRLQAIAGANAGSLRLDICRVDNPSQAMTVESGVPASAPDRAGAGSATDRRDCQSWTLQPNDPPAIATARVLGAVTNPPPLKSVEAPCGEPQRGFGIDPTFVRHGQFALRADPLNMHARATDAPDPTARVVASTVILLEQGIPIELRIPAKWRGRVTVGVPEGPRATRALQIPNCGITGSSPAWGALVATFWTDKPVCAHIMVKTPTAKRRVRLGIGEQCRPQ